MKYKHWNTNTLNIYVEGIVGSVINKQDVKWRLIKLNLKYSDYKWESLKKSSNIKCQWHSDNWLIHYYTLNFNPAVALATRRSNQITPQLVEKLLRTVQPQRVQRPTSTAPKLDPGRPCKDLLWPTDGGVRRAQLSHQAVASLRLSADGDADCQMGDEG